MGPSCKDLPRAGPCTRSSASRSAGAGGRAARDRSGLGGSIRSPPVARRLASLLAPELVVGGLAVGVLVIWAVDGGGSEPTSWYPGALFFAGLLAIALFGFVVRRPAGWAPPARAVVVAIGLLGAFAAWSLLSITWADVKGDAWDGANRALLYFTIFAAFAIPTWRATSAAIVLGLFAFGTACVGMGTMIDVNAGGDPTLSFIGGNLIDPTGYHNATAALFLVASVPAALLASRPEVPWPLRGLMLASAGVLVEMAIPAQSRGSAIVLPLALLVYFAVVPNRVRALLWLVPVALAAGVAAPSLLDIYSTIQDGGDVEKAVSDATSAVVVSAVVLIVVGTIAAALESRIEIPAAVRRRSGYVAGGATALAAAVALVVAVNAIGDPIDWAEARWKDFKNENESDDQQFGSSRFTGDLGSNRYDFWRVAVDEFADHPLTGVGSENFAVDYLRDRRSAEEPQHPHSLELRVLGQTGLVGTALFGGFLIATGVAVASVRRRAGPRLTRGLAAASIALSAYWLLHSSGDWLWVFPAVTGPALAFLAMGARLELDAVPQQDGAPAAQAPASRRRPAAVWAVASALVVAFAFAAVSYLLPLIAAKDVDAAAGGWSSDPGAAFDRLDQARSLNFLSDEPDVVAGAIAERLHQYDRMRASFEGALDRNPYNWYSLLELGALDAVQGRRDAAIEQLQAAAELNPREPAIKIAMRRARTANPLPLRALDRLFLERVCARFGQTTETRFCAAR